MYAGPLAPVVNANVPTRQRRRPGPGDNLYYGSRFGLPGLLTTRSRGWQQLADANGQQIVPGRYEFVLRCQEPEFLGSTFEQWSGAVTFASPTAWSAVTPSPPRALPTNHAGHDVPGRNRLATVLDRDGLGD